MTDDILDPNGDGSITDGDIDKEGKKMDKYDGNDDEEERIEQWDE